MSTKDPFLNRQIDEYRIEALLGIGGMARVYRGIDVRLKRYVAVKVIDFPHQNDSAYIARFEREAQVIAQLSHPNIVPLYRYGEIDEYLYMVMQYIDGSDLHTVLSSYRADGEYMDYDDVVRIIDGICQALDYVHQRGVIHRDIKPSNILLSKEGRPILSDFGLALITQVGTLGEIFGSPHYMAPEQAVSSAQAEPRSDIYSLGVILYEILTGKVPFQAKDPVEIAMQHIKNPVPLPREIRPEISPQIEEVILKALAKDPKERYPDGASFAVAFKGAVHASREANRPPSTASSLSVPERVLLQAASKPLPPLKHPDREPVKEIIKEADQEKSPSRPTPRYLIPVLIGISLLCLTGMAVLCVSGFMVSTRLASRLLAGEGSTIASTPTRATGSGIDPTSSISITATPKPAGAYRLRVTKMGDEVFILINEGEGGFPLQFLQLGNPPNEIEGAAWGIDTLQKGECVAVKSKGVKLKKLEGIDCTRVGKELEIEGREPFWIDTFFVFFQGKYAANCDGSVSQCDIKILVDR